MPFPLLQIRSQFPRAIPVWAASLKNPHGQIEVIKMGVFFVGRSRLWLNNFLKLSGGFKYFLFSPLFGEDEPILTNIFQMG